MQTAKGRPRLEKAGIVESAIGLLNDDGYEALTLRKLAARLGVQAPALYWHFADRAALLEAMVTELQDRVPVAPVPMTRGETGDWILARGIAFRQILHAIRDSVRLFAEATINPTMDVQFTEMLSRIEGLDRRQVVYLAAVLNSYVLGWVHYEQQPEMVRFMGENLDVEADFEAGLRAIAIGITAQMGV
ncbi:hypothetical protein GCM10011494_19710 [Novosphingobium endophyticum]|uniref:HTH tetR-type domain-containing protein n=1 Tax=Novosphingobium endophyticum TaxID=1955250 RepID=A0A916TSM4_9SPHN|nr:TetR family transcriptional regulator [Novosphingobium endophyticum]GGC01188.1 hypothetical protein GCM10011494_19710 [Novosphingobium endophyticum]